jgi:hypothetical protein
MAEQSGTRVHAVAGRERDRISDPAMMVMMTRSYANGIRFARKRYGRGIAGSRRFTGSSVHPA